MNFKKLRYFVVVAEELHFGRAAERLHIAQPPLSQQIRSLEVELGVTLFERSTQRVALTRAGAALLPDARNLLQTWHNSQQKVQSMAKGELGTVSVGFVWAAGTPEFLRGIAAFKARWPGATLQLNEFSTVDALQALSMEQIELAFVLLNPSVDVSIFETEFYERQATVVALPEQHPLASRREVRLQELKDESFIVFARQSHPSLYDQLMNSLHRAGVEPKIVQVARLTQTTRALVAAGIGISLVPESTQHDQREGLVYRPIIGDLPPLDIYIAWKASRETPLMEKFRHHIRVWKRAGIDAPVST
jgi:DNA-binding transcriptional LysR family regulator